MKWRDRWLEIEDQWETGRLQEKLVIWLAWHLPKRVVYWAFIRVATYDYQFDPGGRTVSHALDRWGERE